MKRTAEEIKKQIQAAIGDNPEVTDKELGEQLLISPRFMKKILKSMLLDNK